MIDLNDVRQRPEAYIEAARRKRMSIDITAFIELDKQYRRLKVSVDEGRAKQNALKKELQKLSGPEKQQRIIEMKNLAASLKEDEQELREAEEKWQREQLLIPSIPLDIVPDGKDDTENVERWTWGEIPKFSFQPKDHVQLGTELDIIDIERGVKLAGARTYFLKGDAVRLQHAVLSLAMDRLAEKGYTIMDPPHIVKYIAMMGTGYFPGGEEAAYALDERDAGYYLIGTSEVPVASYHYDEILQLSDLPKRYAGFSPCYRREAGTYGKDTHGLYRIHQFYKVEQVIICRADTEESMRFHKEILGNAEELLRLMKLPYRVVDVCSGDMGQGQVYKNDIETWMPSRGSYGETHSCSSLYDFQARRLGLRYKDENGKSTYCFTLNNTCIASPRILIPLLEVYQNEDGSVTIPEALRKYMGGQERITKK